MDTVFIVVIVAAIVLSITYRKQIQEFLASRQPPEPEQKSSGTKDHGNIRPIVGEERDPDPLPSDLHMFPDRDPPETRFEELNWRLFVATRSPEKSLNALPKTTIDDFPTRLEFSTDAELIALCEKHLRPGYPVIVDYYGWWAKASAMLEYDNFYEDPCITAYLALPAEQRPVIVSLAAPREPGELIIMRYGFEHFRVQRDHLRPLMTQSYQNLFRALLGTRTDWTWFSIARMRKSVTVEDRNARQLANALIVATENQRKHSAAKKHANRFVALWDLRRPATINTVEGAVSEAPSVELAAEVKEAEA